MKTTNKFFSGIAATRVRLAMVMAIVVAAMVGFSVPANAAPPDQTITFYALADKVFWEPAFAVSATADSGLPVTFSATGDCTVTGNTVSLKIPVTLPGVCTITASQDGGTLGNDTFNAAVPVARTFAVGNDLYAVSGTTSLPGVSGAVSLPVLGYGLSSAPVTKPGGDPIVVTQGATVTIRLHNTLTVPTSLLFQGQNMVPDITGVAPGATKDYTFVASQPGTFLYEAGLLSGTQYQAAMGLHGALIVRPAASTAQAYADPLTGFNDEAVLVLSEIDTALNDIAALQPGKTPADFDMREFAPLYFLINGQVYPNTAAIPSVPGNRVLLRYVNAGAQHHSMATLGLRQNFVAKDAGLLPMLTHNVVAETLAPGQTGDAIATVPATAVNGSKFAVYDGSLKLYNDGVGSSFGGMLTFVAISGTPGGDTVGPATTSVLVSPFGILNATVSDVGRGGSNVTAAEYFLDTTGANASGVSMTTTDAAGLTRTYVSPAALTGNHTVYVHGLDAAGNWGPYQVTVIYTDTTGPITSALVLSPNPNSGGNVTISGTANDTTTGGSNIAAAEYQFNGGGWLPMTVSPVGAKIASISATIPAATFNLLTTGQYTVAVRSTDSAATANVGAAVNIALNLIKVSGPVTSNVSAAPNPNNGAVPLSATQPVVRVTATVSCAATCLNVGGAEGFIDTMGANGTGFPFVPADGAWNGLTEQVYADIPLSTIAALPNGNHTIFVHGKEAVGVWEVGSVLPSTVLVVDKTAPTVTVSAAASTVAFGNAVTINVVASDVGTGVVARQYWVDGSATPPANPTAFTGASFNVSGLTGGTHTIYVRVQDGATNWSTVVSVTVYVVQAVNDARSFNANTSTTQNSDANSGAGVLANDLPTGAGRTSRLFSAPARTGGTGTGTISLSCPGSLGTAATPAVSGSTICTNGAYRVTLTGVGGNNAARQASKRGTYQFTYTEVFGGVTSNATVTINVN